MLAGIKDTATATAAKAPLEAIVLQLQTAKNAAPAATTTDALGGIGKLGAAAATYVAAREVLSPQSFARAIGRPSRSRFSAWLAR